MVDDPLGHTVRSARTSSLWVTAPNCEVAVVARSLLVGRAFGCTERGSGRLAGQNLWFGCRVALGLIGFQDFADAIEGLRSQHFFKLGFGVS